MPEAQLKVQSFSKKENLKKIVVALAIMFSEFDCNRPMILFS